jgi:hypothetical protein
MIVWSRDDLGMGMGVVAISSCRHQSHVTLVYVYIDTRYMPESQSSTPDTAAGVSIRDAVQTSKDARPRVAWRIGPDHTRTPPQSQTSDPPEGRCGRLVHGKLSQPTLTSRRQPLSVSLHSLRPDPSTTVVTFHSNSCPLQRQTITTTLVRRRTTLIHQHRQQQPPTHLHRDSCCCAAQH